MKFKILLLSFIICANANARPFGIELNYSPFGEITINPEVAVYHGERINLKLKNYIEIGAIGNSGSAGIDEISDMYIRAYFSEANHSELNFYSKTYGLRLGSKIFPLPKTPFIFVGFNGALFHDEYFNKGLILDNSSFISYSLGLNAGLTFDISTFTKMNAEYANNFLISSSSKDSKTWQVMIGFIYLLH